MTSPRSARGAAGVRPILYSVAERGGRKERPMPEPGARSAPWRSGAYRAAAVSSRPPWRRGRSSGDQAAGRLRPRPARRRAGAAAAGLNPRTAAPV